MLSASALLTVWEQGLERPLFERALLLLAAACGQPRESLALLAIGQRDAYLLDVREALFGRNLPCLLACSQCAEQLELNLNIDDLRIPAIPEPAPDSHCIQADGLGIVFRLPNSMDLSIAASANDAQAARTILLQRCLLAVDGQEQANADSLSASALAALMAAMAEADPQSQLELDLCCPACGHHWQAVFDIASYLWSEVHTWAVRIVREVHLLASAYGWREADILALSPLRRQLYLNSVVAS